MGGFATTLGDRYLGVLQQMTNWRDKLLNEFTPGVGKTFVVADPDRLMAEPQFNEALARKGFAIVFYDDPIAFRFAYETKYRSHSDAQHLPEVIVAYHADKGSLNKLPCDLLARSTKLHFSLAELFPMFSYPVLSALPPQYLDLLFDSQIAFDPDNLGEHGTEDFILSHVFGFSADAIGSDSDLLCALLRLHYHPHVIPTQFLNRLVDAILQTGHFDGWEIETLFSNRNRFFEFLQERWPAFLARALDGRAMPSMVPLTIPGPPILPFENPDIRVYIDTLFLEGLLQPIEWPNVPQTAADWFLVGIRRDPHKDTLNRFIGLLDIAERDLPTLDDRHDAWLGYSETWAQLGMIVNQLTAPLNSDLALRLLALRDHLDSVFLPWLEKRFGGLHNLPATPPVLVHHIPRYLAHLRASGSISKLALIVIDGLAFDQWLALRDELLHGKRHWKFDQGAVFAWVPTITSVSRQALFAGKAPQYFPSSIYSTDKDAALWQQFWSDHGLSSGEVVYQKGLGEPSSLASVEEIALSSRLKIVGLVVDKVDRIMHGMEMGTSGMHNQVRQWAREGFLASLFGLLVTNGYAVFVTSDHGNIEAVGCGRPNEGAIADIRGERVRIYSDDILRARIGSRFPSAIKWPPVGLPENFYPLFPPDRQAFTLEGFRTVAHGGTTLDEVVVPFVRVMGASQ
jgi:hypothetical protein